MLGLLDKRDVRVTHRMADMGSWEGDAAGSLATRGLPSRTQFATTSGWQSVETVAVRDEVLTFDDGQRPVVAMTRPPIASQFSRQSDFARPVHAPADAPDSVTRPLGAVAGLPAPYPTFRGDTARRLVAAIAAGDARQVEGGIPAA